MKKRMLLVFGLVLALSALFMSCNTLGQDAAAALPLARSPYTILGEVSASAQGQEIFGFLFVIVDGDAMTDYYGTAPTLFSPIVDSVTRVKAAAVYKALTQMPDADAVLAPVYSIEKHGFPGFRQVTVSVKAKGIDIPEGKVSN
ncbi:MAG: hypothetical protein LBQ55_03480 [Treponema sp.]|nr:hypothetical protein [Treponema sp.]